MPRRRPCEGTLAMMIVPRRTTCNIRKTTQTIMRLLALAQSSLGLRLICIKRVALRQITLASNSVQTLLPHRTSPGKARPVVDSRPAPLPPAILPVASHGAATPRPAAPSRRLRHPTTFRTDRSS